MRGAWVLVAAAIAHLRHDGNVDRASGNVSWDPPADTRTGSGDASPTTTTPTPDLAEHPPTKPPAVEPSAHQYGRPRSTIDDVPANLSHREVPDMTPEERAEMKARKASGGKSKEQRANATKGLGPAPHAFEYVGCFGPTTFENFDVYSRTHANYFDPVRCRDTCVGQYIGLFKEGRTCVCLGDYFDAGQYDQAEGCMHCATPKGCFKVHSSFPCTAASTNELLCDSCHPPCQDDETGPQCGSQCDMECEYCGAFERCRCGADAALAVYRLGELPDARAPVAAKNPAEFIITNTTENATEKDADGFYKSVIVPNEFKRQDEEDAAREAEKKAAEEHARAEQHEEAAAASGGTAKASAREQKAGSSAVAAPAAAAAAAEPNSRIITGFMRDGRTQAEGPDATASAAAQQGNKPALAATASASATPATQTAPAATAPAAAPPAEQTAQASKTPAAAPGGTGAAPAAAAPAGALAGKSAAPAASETAGKSSDQQTAPAATAPAGTPIGSGTAPAAGAPARSPPGKSKEPAAASSAAAGIQAVPSPSTPTPESNAGCVSGCDGMPASLSATGPVDAHMDDPEPPAAAPPASLAWRHDGTPVEVGVVKRSADPPPDARPAVVEAEADPLESSDTSQGRIDEVLRNGKGTAGLDGW